MILVRRLNLSRDGEHYEAAWRWTQLRPHLYPVTGGKETLADYLARARRPEQADFGCFVNDALHSLVTVEMEGEGEFNFHLTSQPKPDWRIIQQAVFTVGEQLFVKLNAQRLYTWIPHLFVRNRRIAQMCGMALQEHAEKDGFQYDIFSITQDEYLKQYGQQ